MASDDYSLPDLDGLAIWARPGLVTDPADPAAEPVAALTCVPALTVHTHDTHPGADPVDVIATTLLSRGFALLAALDLTASPSYRCCPDGPLYSTPPADTCASPIPPGRSTPATSARPHPPAGPRLCNDADCWCCSWPATAATPPRSIGPRGSTQRAAPAAS
jgi:hypothetical protein